MSPFKEFFLNRDDLLQQLQEFASKYNLKFIQELQREDNISQFLSKITEIHFGNFFTPFASLIQQEPDIDSKTPDWAVTINDQKIILEVLRLNASAADQIKLDFIDDFIEKMKEIKIGAFLSFSFVDNIEVSEIDLLICKETIKIWLQTKKQEDDSFILLDCIEIKFLKYSNKVSYVCFMGMGGQIKHDYRRLYADNSPLLKKASKYSDIIEKYNLPYIICIYLDFHTWFDKEDLFTCLYGSSCENATQIPSSYSTIIEKALYYNSLFPLKNVSGILLRQTDNYSYFHNFSVYNRLTQSNKNILLKWQCPYH